MTRKVIWKLPGPSVSTGVQVKTPVLGLTLAQKGNFSAASESLKTFLKAAPAGTNLEQAQKILADVDRLASQKTDGAEKQ